MSTVVVNGDKVQGEIVETDGKALLISVVASQASSNLDNPCIDIRQLYEKKGQLGRTQKAARIDVNDMVEVFSIALELAGLPYYVAEIMEGEI